MFKYTLKIWAVNTAKFLRYVWPFFNMIHETLKLPAYIALRTILMFLTVLTLCFLTVAGIVINKLLRPKPAAKLFAVLESKIINIFLGFIGN